MKIAGVGQGYVGLVTAAGAAEWGHEVVGVEIDAQRLLALQAGLSPIYEPGLAELVGSHVESGRLSFTADTASAVEAARIVFVAVATTDAARSPDRERIRAAEYQARAIADMAWRMRDQDAHLHRRKAG